MPTPNFTLYIQALGGKFLGPNAYNTNDISVTLNYSGGTVSIPYNLNSSPDDGTIGAEFTSGSSSPLPILTQLEIGGVAVNYLTPDANTICAQTSITLPGSEETATITVTIPVPNNISVTITQQILLSPQQDNYRLFLAVPGLLLEPGSTGTANQVAVYVKMMCGCKVTTGLSTSFWYVGDFQVTAQILFSDGSTQIVPMQFDESTNSSLFYANISTTKTIVQTNFSALQQSTGNYGFLAG